MLDDAVNSPVAASPPAEGSVRNPALDGLRTVAILPVLAMHSGAPWAQGGYLGVDLFFVLSGYLITNLLQSELSTRRHIRLKHFYVRRALRLTPQLLAMLLVFVAVAPSFFPWAPVWTEALLSAFYLTDYSRLICKQPTLLAHTWSLSVEEHFYLLWPLLLPLLLRAKRPWRVMALAYLFATTWRIANQQWFGWETTYFRFDTRLSGIILGSWVAIGGVPHFPRFASWAAFAWIALLTAIPTRWTPWSMLVVVTLAEVAAVVLLAQATRAGTILHGAMAHRAPAYIGRLSYGLYLWHFPVMLWLGSRFGWAMTFAIGTGVALAASSAVHHSVDASVRRWRVQLDKKIGTPMVLV